MAKIPYKDGKKHGEARYYDMEGNVVRRETFFAGKLDGVAVDMMPNGTILKESPFKGDLLHGWTIEYNHKGKEVARQQFQEGEPVSAKLEKTRFGHREKDESNDN